MSDEINKKEVGKEQENEQENEQKQEQGIGKKENIDEESVKEALTNPLFIKFFDFKERQALVKYVLTKYGKNSEVTEQVLKWVNMKTNPPLQPAERMAASTFIKAMFSTKKLTPEKVAQLKREDPAFYEFMSSISLFKDMLGN